ncbi:MAG: class I SAM-dependent methyltransferase [Ekhidna sp.]
MNDFLDILKGEEVKKFIVDNQNTDSQKLLLNPPKEFKNNIRIIADQILARKKAKGKLSSWSENIDLIMPPPLSIEQASSESTGIYKSRLLKGQHLIDLTGGMGIDCLALGKYFSKITYVEQQHDLCRVFQHNCDVLGRNINVLNKKAEDVLELLKSDASSKVFYIDPARRDDSKNKVFKLEDCSPNLKELIPIMKELGNQILIKLSPLIDIKSILTEFPHVKEIHIVSIKNDCKELLVSIDFSCKDETTIKTVNLETEQAEYHFKLSEEKNSESQYGNPEDYIFEPNTSILKSGAFKKIGEDFELKKLHKHTHLYTSNSIVKGFPGRVFQIISDADKKSIKQYGSYGKMNVMTRNYPVKPHALKKKWKLKDGGNFFLIGFRDFSEKSNLIIAKRI